jgi:RNA polymerase sigma-70 factor (ECF subfamily)
LTTVWPERLDERSFLQLLGELRPELHRYCARLMGSVVDGEDVVQDALDRAVTSVGTLQSADALRGWLFRIAHNRALDLLRSRSIRREDTLDAAYELATEAPEPIEELLHEEAIRTAVARFLELPIAQRSCVVLKDVLGQSLAEISHLLGISTDAVKGHLWRGRESLKRLNALPPTRSTKAAPSSETERYVALFNAHNWAALRALLADDVKLIQATHPVRSGAADVGMFFSIYSQTPNVRLAPAQIDGRDVIAVFEAPDAQAPAYFMLLEWVQGRIALIRDFRYARYVARDARLVVAGKVSAAAP